jgi:hypothetical protein
MTINNLNNMGGEDGVIGQEEWGREVRNQQQLAAE